MALSKISLVGSGNIGGTLAHLALQRNLGEVTLFDAVEGVSDGKALDLVQALTIDARSSVAYGGQDYSQLKGSHVVIVTAGFPRKPGMTREDLLEKNALVISGIARHIRTYCPEAFIIVITNPLDAMVWVMQHVSGLPYERVVGMAGILDSGRFAYFLSQELCVSPHDIQTLVLGGHGDTMVPLPRYTTVAGIPLMDWVKNGKLNTHKLEQIIERTRQGGAEIVKLLKTGSAFYAPAHAALIMAESFLFNQRRILPCATHIHGPYGLQNIYMGVPVIIGSGGVEEIIELELDDQEKKEFLKSSQSVSELIQEVSKILANNK
jgi:malate dehydrogenase